MQNPDITLSQLKKLIEDTLDGKQPKFIKKTFMEYMDEYLEEKAPLIKYRTLGKFRSFKFVMGEYLELRGIDPDSFMFESIDHDFAPDFHDYLIHTRKLVNNTISKYFEVVGVIMKWGLRKKYHRNTAFQDFATVPRDKTEIVFLELDEVRAIEELNLSGDLDFARTVFLFALYAGGQRLSDIKKLRHKDIVFGDDGTAEWRLFQFKGKKTVKNILPLLPQAIAFLKKCYRDDLSLTDRLVFSLGYEQNLNDNINEICRLAGITEQLHFRHYSGVNLVESGGAKFDFVTMKTARKSFVSIGLSLGMAPDLIIQYTGHTTTKVMQKHYLGVSQNFKREALFKFWAEKK
jgi:integrase